LVVVTAGLCLHLWGQGAMTPGAVAAAIGLVLRLVQMSTWLIHLVRGGFENIGSVQERIGAVPQPPHLTAPAGAVPLAVGKGGIRFEHVSFGYGRKGGLFEELNLEIRPGEKVGLVGPSGAGKSTLVNLLLRLYPLDGGRILIDGQDIAGVTQD